jgi:hypothetical protein
MRKRSVQEGCICSASADLYAAHGPFYDSFQLFCIEAGAIFAQTLLGPLGREPSGRAERLMRHLKVHHPAEVRVYGMDIALKFAMQIPGKSLWFNLAAHAGLFVSLASGSACLRGIAINSALRKRPSSATGAHQKKLDIAIRISAIAHRRDNHASRELPPLLPQRLL